MIGFPRHIATKKDYENLLQDKDYKELAVKELEKLQDFDDRTVTIAIEPLDPDNPESEWETQEIDNPYPLHQQKGFQEWMDIVNLNARYTRGRASIASRKKEILAQYEIGGLKI
jgi:hypothetical protein